MAYFHPWVIRSEDARQHVPTFEQLAGTEGDVQNKWMTACKKWLDGNVLTEEMKRTVQNFFAVTRVRPSDEEVECSTS